MTLYERLQRYKTKRRLKAAFKRKPRPAKVKLKDDNDRPYDLDSKENAPI